MAHIQLYFRLDRHLLEETTGFICVSSEIHFQFYAVLLLNYWASANCGKYESGPL